MGPGPTPHGSARPRHETGARGGTRGPRAQTVPNDATPLLPAVQDLVAKLPFKIDIGAIFSNAPRDHKKFKVFEPVQREFIIDIDLTDYDFLDVDVKRLETCDRCWPLMALALKVLTRSLKEDFGFDHLLWVYSGRRGIHCWVCDPRARAMSNEVG